MGQALSESRAQIGYVSPTPAKKVAEGKAWFAGAKLTLAAIPGSLHVENPATVNGQPNRKLLFILGWSVYGTATSEVRYVHESTSTAALVVPFNPNHAYHAATPVAVVRAGAIAGGEVLSPIALFTTQSPIEERQRLIIVPPGHTFALQVSAATGDYYLNLEWYEDIAD